MTAIDALCKIYREKMKSASSSVISFDPINFLGMSFEEYGDALLEEMMEWAYPSLADEISVELSKRQALRLKKKHCSGDGRQKDRGTL